MVLMSNWTHSTSTVLVSAYLFLHRVSQQLNALEVDGALQSLLAIFLLLALAAFLADTEAAAEEDDGGHDADRDDGGHRHCNTYRGR